MCYKVFNNRAKPRINKTIIIKFLKTFSEILYLILEPNCYPINAGIIRNKLKYKSFIVPKP